MSSKTNAEKAIAECFCALAVGFAREGDEFCDWKNREAPGKVFDLIAKLEDRLASEFELEAGEINLRINASDNIPPALAIAAKGLAEKAYKNAMAGINRQTSIELVDLISGELDKRKDYLSPYACEGLARDMQVALNERITTKGTHLGASRNAASRNRSAAVTF